MLNIHKKITDIFLNEVQNGRPPLGAAVAYKSGSVSKEILESLYEKYQDLSDTNTETTTPQL